MSLTIIRVDNHSTVTFQSSSFDRHTSNNRGIIRRVVLFAVRVISKESRRLVLPRTYCFFFQFAERLDALFRLSTEQPEDIVFMPLSEVGAILVAESVISRCVNLK